MIKNLLLVLAALLLQLNSINAQVGVGTLTPDSSSILDISATNKGVLFPRVALRGANIDSPLTKPVKGLIVWNTGSVWGTAGFYYNNSDTTIPSWTRVASGSVMQNVLGLGKIWIGDSTNLPMERTMSGDVTINVSGVSAIGVGKVNSSKIADSSVATVDIAENAVTGTKINITGNTAGSMMYYDGTNWVNLSKTSSGEVLLLNGSGNPSWSRVESVMNVQNGIQKVTTAPNASVTAPYLELGGSLIRNTTITQGVFSYTHDLTAAGNYRINHVSTAPGAESTYPFGVNRNGSTDYTIGSDASYVYLQSWNSKPIQFNSQGNNMLFNPNSGNIAIGHFAPNNKLDITNAARSGTHAVLRPLYVTGIFGANNSGVEFRHANGTQGIGFGYNTIYATGSSVNQDLGMQSLGTGNLFYLTNGAQRMTILGSNGNIGMGVTNPAYALELNGSFGYGNGTSGSYRSRTETRDNAGLQASQSGFFETSVPTNYPAGASSWWHLLDVRHSNNANNYAMQIAGSFFDQDLYFRKTNGSATTAWSKFLSSTSGWTTNGNAGTNDPAAPVTYGTSAIAANENWMGTTDANDVVFGTNTLERMRIKQTTGNVGIGTASPLQKLNVVGNSLVTGDMYIRNNLGGGTFIGTIHHGVNGLIGQTTTFNPNSGQDGLWIEGSSDGESAGLFLNGNTAILWSPGDADLFRIYDEDGMPTGNPAFVVNGAGNVGIGQPVPNAPLHFANSFLNRKIILWESTVGSDHLFYGFGINGGMLRYQVDGTSSNHVFYAGTSTTTSNELMRIQGNGNVGIGTPAPSSRLHIDVPANKDGNPSDNGLYVYNASTDGGDNDDAIVSARVNGATAGDPFLSLDIAGVTGWSVGIDNSDADKFKIANSWSDPATNTRLTIDGAGNMGIGTTTPGAKLDVLAGNMIGMRLLSGNAAQYAGFQMGRSTPDMSIGVASTAGQWSTDASPGDIVYRTESGSQRLFFQSGSGASAMVIRPDNRVQIGDNLTFNAAATFAVSRDDNTYNYTAGFRNVTNAAGVSNNGIFLTAGQSAFGQTQFLQVFFRPDATGIGSITQNASNSIAFNTTSDIRLKTNLTDTKYGLNTINKIQVKDYYYKDDLTRQQNGFIAQQLYEVYPHAVTVGEEDAKEHPWMVDYGKLTPPLVKAVQELSKENDELKKAVELLTKRLEALEQKK